MTAALTSLGVCSATGRPRRAAASIATPADLGRAHDRADVVLREDPLDGDGVRGGAPRATRSISPRDREQPLVDVRRRVGRAHDAHVHERGAPPGQPVDDADAAPGQAGVDAEHAHAPTVAAGRRSAATDTAAAPSGPSHRVAPIGGYTVVGVELGLHVGGGVEVGEDVLHVVAVLERVDEPEHLAGGVGVDLDLEAGYELDVGGVVVDAGVLQRAADGDQVGRLGDDLERLARGR